MTLPLTGTISASMINLELGRAAGAPFSLNDPAVRALAGKPTGAISFSDFYGKSMREPPEGDYFEHSIHEWGVHTSGTGHIIWQELGMFVAGNMAVGGSTQWDHQGWRYHRGSFKYYGSAHGWGIYHNFYGVWRERI